MKARTSSRRGEITPGNTPSSFPTTPELIDLPDSPQLSSRSTSKKIYDFFLGNKESKNQKQSKVEGGSETMKPCIDDLKKNIPEEIQSQPSVSNEIKKTAVAKKK